MESSNLSVVVNNSESVARRELEYAKDIWQLPVVGIKPPPYIRNSFMNFKDIEPVWLRNLAKKFIRFQSATKAFYTLVQYLRSIKHFSLFLLTYKKSVHPEEIDRSFMLNFIAYVHGLNGVNEAKNKIITHTKLVITLAALEDWENVTKEKIMYRDDRLPVIRAKPRYIPNHVLDQLNRHIDSLPLDIKRLVMLLQHTGRRVGEICALPVDCMIQDGEGDFFLRYYEFKMKKEETIPINHKIAAVIKEQRLWVIDQYGATNIQYLFTAKDFGAVQSDTVRQALHNLAKKHAITGYDGKIWYFQPHQFRHTVGTQMINSGVPAHIVQRYLKHSSPEMTMNYSHLHDSTMKAEFAKFQGKMVDITGKIVAENPDINVPTDLKWLKRNVLAQALPNGYCGLPIQQGGCPHANACLSCSHFKTTAQFMGQHKQQLQETERILNTAEQNGWTRQIEMNKKVKNSLESIIVALETSG